jgi:hypothetical protein
MLHNIARTRLFAHECALAALPISARLCLLDPDQARAHSPTQAKLEQCNGVLRLPLIKNKKTVNPRDSSSAPVFQLETAMGSAIECFDDSGAVVVPRERFAPVKTTNDLFGLRSDAFKVSPYRSSFHFAFLDLLFQSAIKSGAAVVTCERIAPA